MERTNPKAAAPMPKSEEDIRNNSMKLFAYLMTIAGLADYPDNTRMFRQKDLMLTKIKEATKITDKTVKLYLYYLEQNGLIVYRGKYIFDFFEIRKTDYPSPSAYRKALQEYAASIWKLRNKEEKNGVYHIPRPMPYTPVPEITLKRLNEDYHISELELDIYLFMCKYRDECVAGKRNFKAMTYEQFRDILGLTKDAGTDKNIFNALCFLEKIGLISVILGYTVNRKNAKIPVFKIQSVEYYISNTVEFSEKSLMASQEQGELKDLNKRVNLGNQKYLDKLKEMTELQEEIKYDGYI